MEYLSKIPVTSPIICCEVTYVSREQVEAVGAIPSAHKLMDACHRFNDMQVHGGALLTKTIAHIESTQNRVLAHLYFNYDKERRERVRPYLDKELEALPYLNFGSPGNPPVVLEDLIDFSIALGLPENQDPVGRALLSTMLEEAAFLLAKASCQGSA